MLALRYFCAFLLSRIWAGRGEKWRILSHFIYLPDYKFAYEFENNIYGHIYGHTGQGSMLIVSRSFAKRTPAGANYGLYVASQSIIVGQILFIVWSFLD